MINPEQTQVMVIDTKLHLKLNQLLFPVVDCCCIIYDNVLFSNQMIRVNSLVNCAVGFIFKLRQYVDLATFMKSLGWMAHLQNRKYFKLVLLLKTFKSKRQYSFTIKLPPSIINLSDQPALES